MKIKKLGVYFIIFLVIWCSGSLVYAEKSKQTVSINNAVLEFDKIIYVDVSNGNDDINNGSKVKPFKTVEKAFTTIIDKSLDYAIVMGEGEYNFGTFTQFTTSKINKIAYIGTGQNTILKLKGWDYSNTRAKSNPCKSEHLFYNLVWDGNGINKNNTFGTLSNWEFNNIVFKNCPSGYGYFVPNNNSELTMNNCIKLDDEGSFLRTTHGTMKLTNCYGNFTSGYSTNQSNWDYKTNIITPKPNIGPNYNILDPDWENTGTGTNPDGTVANIGVFGGEFAWGDWEESQTLSLDIEASNYEMLGGTQFETYVVINNSNNIYAEDINITYDTDLFELVSTVPVNDNDLKIYHQKTATLGEARYVVASKGADCGLDGDAQILKLTFKAKNVNGSGDIAISSGIVADGKGIEVAPSCAGKTFTITRQNLGDVNKDGEFTLGDLAIAGRLFASKSDTWGEYEPDVDANGNVEDIDLTTIVQSILANENN
jgi:hypothetical protein